MQFPIVPVSRKLRNYLQKDLGADLAAGLTGATAGVPQAMAFAIVAGISPVYGLYTAIVSTIVAGLLGSSTFMTTGPTNALAVVVGSTLAPFTNSDDLLFRLITLTFLVGIIQTAMGFLRLGGLTRYVSGAVMTGFVTGAALLVLLGQIPHLTGLPAGSQDNILLKTGDLLRHIDRLQVETFGMGIAAMVIILAMHQTRLSSFATLIAIVVTGAGVALLNWNAHGVELVRDLSPIPNSLPQVTLPRLGLMPELAPAALAIAVLGLVQTAALSQSITEPDGGIPEASREFVGQGAANALGALFQNMPAGGSLSRTAVNIKAGAHTRWANIWAGVFSALIVLLFGGLAERIALAALAGHLIVAAITLISPARIGVIWRASWTGRWAMLTTFASTLLLPLEYSVYVGVVLSLILYIFQSSHMKVTRLESVGNGLFRETELPAVLPDDNPLIVSVHGHLYFAAMRDLRQKLPMPNGVKHLTIILRMRGDELLAGTGASVLAEYAEQLRVGGGKLILCGVEKPVWDTLRRTGMLRRIGEENVFRADDVLLSSLQKALKHAHEWLDEQKAAEGR